MVEENRKRKKYFIMYLIKSNLVHNKKPPLSPPKGEETYEIMQ
jgi:hypothetical protein